MQVSKWLGHSTFMLTLDTYGDYIPEQDGGALNTLPEPPARYSVSRRWATRCRYLGAARDQSLSPELPNVVSDHVRAVAIADDAHRCSVVRGAVKQRAEK